MFCIVSGHFNPFNITLYDEFGADRYFRFLHFTYSECDFIAFSGYIRRFMVIKT
jgi:hypothetical protein